MEPEIRLFFAKIVKSISMTVLWMMLNMTLGIFFNLGIIYSGLTLINVLFYIFLLVTFLGLIWYLLRVWKQTVEE